MNTHHTADRTTLLTPALDAVAETVAKVEQALERLQEVEARMIAAQGDREYLQSARARERLLGVLGARERRYFTALARLKALSRELSMPKREGLAIDPAVDPEDEDVAADPRANLALRAKRLAAASAGDPGAMTRNQESQKRWASKPVAVVGEMDRRAMG